MVTGIVGFCVGYLVVGLGVGSMVERVGPLVPPVTEGASETGDRVGATDGEAVLDVGASVLAVGAPVDHVGCDVGALVGAVVIGAFVGAVVIGAFDGALVVGAFVGAFVIGAFDGAFVIGAFVVAVVSKTCRRRPHKT